MREMFGVLSICYELTLSRAYSKLVKSLLYLFGAVLQCLAYSYSYVNKYVTWIAIYWSYWWRVKKRTWKFKIMFNYNIIYNKVVSSFSKLKDVNYISTRASSLHCTNKQLTLSSREIINIKDKRYNQGEKEKLTALSEELQWKEKGNITGNINAGSSKNRPIRKEERTSDMSLELADLTGYNHLKETSFSILSTKIDIIACYIN